MPQPRKPTRLLELSGQLRHNKKRYAGRLNEPQASGPLGDPPERLSADEKAAWLELEQIAPAGVLTKADRWLVEICAGIMASLRRGGIGREGVTNGEVSLLMAGLRSMGLTPADRSRVSVPKEAEEDNPFTELAARSRDRRIN